MTHHLVELRDHRHIGVTGLGDPAAHRLVLMCHPTPGAGGFDPDPTATATAGIRMITLDRPGYGASETSPEAPNPLDAWLNDVDEYLESIEAVAQAVADTEYGEIGVIGWGVGAVYATALTARHPELVNRLALIEPTGPTRSLRHSAESDVRLDERLEDLDALDALDGHAGASDRMGLMLDSAGRGDGGMHLDVGALRDPRWEETLGSIRARTVIMSSDRSDGAWYRRRVRGAREFGTWTNPATTIVEAWDAVLGFLTTER